MTKKILKISKYRPSVFQGKLDFSGASGVSLALQHPLERGLARFLAAALLLCVAGYLYFITASVMNVVARREAGVRSAAIEGSIGSLEREYFALSNAVEPEAAAEIGLVPVSQTAYVYRPGPLGAATIASNAI